MKAEDYLTQEMIDKLQADLDDNNGVIDWDDLEPLLDGFKEQLLISGVIKRIEEYAPKPVELPEFDYKQKADHLYCVEWGMKKAKRNEFEVYQKMLKELKDKYVL